MSNNRIDLQLVPWRTVTEICDKMSNNMIDLQLVPWRTVTEIGDEMKVFLAGKA